MRDSAPLVVWQKRNVGRMSIRAMLSLAPVWYVYTYFCARYQKTARTWLDIGLWWPGEAGRKGDMGHDEKIIYLMWRHLPKVLIDYVAGFMYVEPLSLMEPLRIRLLQEPNADEPIRGPWVTYPIDMYPWFSSSTTYGMRLAPQMPRNLRYHVVSGGSASLRYCT